MYGPDIVDGQPLRRYAFPEHTALLITDVASRGRIQYRHVIVAWKDSERTPCLYVTSEVSTTDPQECFFCIFDEDARRNFGSAVEWNSLERFEERALEMLTERFGLLIPADTGGRTSGR